MNMGIEIERVVQDLGRVSIEQVLHEAIMNSIDAKAKNIDISINYQDPFKHVDIMSVKDDGEGFIKENINSFTKYKTTHKQDIGAKGVGRFLFLKLFNRVSIVSHNTTIEFDINDVVINKTTANSIKTVINFAGVKQGVDINLDTIEGNIKEHFLPYFHLIKTRDEAEIKINLIANNETIFNISSKDIPNFQTDTFQLKEFKFTLDYVLNHYATKKHNGFYCADNRVVIKNNKGEKGKLKSFRGINILFLLSAEYLNTKVNDTRDDFSIHPKQKNSMLGDLSWVEIQEALSENLKNILRDNGIDVEEEAKKELSMAIDEAPYLSQYLLDNPYGKESKKLIEDAEKKLKTDKSVVREATHNGQQEYNEKISIIMQAELAEYIFDRQKIIDNLKKITKESEIEKQMHNLFMRKNTTDEKQDYRSNNLWLFDDRFMVYDKVFSDKQIKDIFPTLAENLKRPDILSIVSNTYDKEKITDIVIIELKRPDNKITPAGAEEQLLDYARYANDANSDCKIRIWTYAFLAFNQETCDKLESKDYNKIPTHSDHPIYYKYYEKVNVIINFMDYQALAEDADVRNKTFMSILTEKQPKKI